MNLMKSIFTLFLIAMLSMANAQPTYTTQVGTGNNTFSFNSATNNKLQNI